MRRAVHALLADISRWLRPESRKKPTRAVADRESAITIVSVLAGEEDREMVSRAGQSNQWEARAAGSVEEGRKLAGLLNPQVILLDRDLAGTGWRNLIAEFAAAASGTCVILVSKVMDDNLWSEVVSNGGYEVLSKPLREEQLARTVRMARSYWATANKWAAVRK